MSESSPPPTSRPFAPTPVETTVKKVRRFAPEPVETTARSNRKAGVQDGDEGASNSAAESVDTAAAAPPKRRFLPEPVETTFKSSKQAGNLPTPESTPEAEEPPKPRRRFAPQLIETTKRTKRAGDSSPATLPTDKTDLTPGVPNIYTREKRKAPRPLVPVPAPPVNSPRDTIAITNIHKSSHQAPFLPRRQGSMKPHNNTRRSTRQNSYQPELEDIASDASHENSDEEQDEDTPSLSGSVGSSQESLMRLQLARTRESCDDRFSGYLLALAAKAAEKQLREQALAAFPNETMHEIVEHFYDREIDMPSDEDGVEGVGRLVDDDEHVHPPRRQSTEVGWAAKEMQQHQEKLSRLREEETNKKLAEEASKPTFPDPFWTNGITTKPARSPAEKAKQAELDRMRLAASPPMLGGDLKFRMCPSPKATKFESDQRIDVQKPKRCENGGGLWSGYCVADEPGTLITPTHRGPSMIHTPHSEREDPFSSAFATQVPNGGSKTPKTPGAGGGPRNMLLGIDERLQAEVAKAKAEEALLQEFDDAFVTQVYNYLSLGYPALAWSYDEELSRISQTDIEELRRDDSKKNAKGHINIEDEKGTPEHSKCARWKALRIYILEWGRQHPSMSNGVSSPSAWGVRARRGSWAI